MIPWVTLDRAEMPDGSGELRLVQRDREYSIRLGMHELMNSRLSGSEEALATASCARLRERTRPRLLIGGLGMGFTLRAALAVLGPQARITVAEWVPAVVGWARGPLADLFAGSLEDPRVAVREGDVVDSIRGGRAAWDAILLDVDNGPEGLTRLGNDRLYDAAGLGSAWSALRPGGILAVWSSGPDRRFAERLHMARFAVEEIRVRAHRARGGARHVIWLATRS